jgi:hypothetical protein
MAPVTVTPGHSFRWGHGHGHLNTSYTEKSPALPPFGVGTLFRRKAESVLPKYWETISGVPPDSITWTVGAHGLGLGPATLHVGLRSSRSRAWAFQRVCHCTSSPCLNHFDKLSVTVPVTVTVTVTVTHAHVLFVHAFMSHYVLPCVLCVCHDPGHE